jgi:DNA polymerase III sliding clamp (beta) subunit (PCNA family)
VLDEIDVLSWLEETEPVSSVAPVKSTHAGTLISTESSGTCFEINREVLLSLLDKVMPVVPSRDIIPVLTNLQFRVSAEQLQIVASSTEMTMVVTTSQVDCKVAGIEVFPAKTFSAIIKETLAGSNVYVEATSHGLVIVAGTYTAEIAIGSGQGFPKSDSIEELTFHEINRNSFINAITSVKYALPDKDYSGQDSMKMISIKGGKFTACDGARFQQVRIEGFKLNMQLPTFSINTLIKVLSNTDQVVLELGETAKKLVFKFSNCVFYLNKLDTPYPNVEQLWLRPALTNDQELLVNKAELVTAIKQVKVAADTASNAIGLILDENQITVTAKDTNNGAKTVIPCKWAGKPKTIVVNFMHLAEMLKSFPGTECRFLLGEDNLTYKAPILLKDNDTMSIATIAQLLAYRAGL